MIVVGIREGPVGFHDRRRRDHTDAHGDARDEQLRESKRPRSSSFDLVYGTAFDRVVHGHRRGRVEECIATTVGAPRACACQPLGCRV